jgi:uncharacterized membrane protein
MAFDDVDTRLIAAILVAVLAIAGVLAARGLALKLLILIVGLAVAAYLAGFYQLPRF